MSRLLDTLREAKIIDEAQAEKILAMHQETSQPVTRCVLDLGIVSEDELLQRLSDHLHLPKINLRTAEVDLAVVESLDQNVCIKYLVFPVRISNLKLILAMAQPWDVLAIDDVSFITGKRVEVVLTTELMILDAIEQYYTPQAPTMMVPNITDRGEDFKSVIEDFERTFEDIVPALPPPPPAESQTMAETIIGDSPFSTHPPRSLKIVKASKEAPPSSDVPRTVEEKISVPTVPPVVKQPFPVASLKPAQTDSGPEWKSAGIYLSMPFQDTIAERDYFMLSLLPYLRQNLLQHHIHLWEFDPAQGFDSEKDAEDARPLKLHLDTIPSLEAFLGILGDQFGNGIDSFPADALKSYSWLNDCKGYSKTAIEITQAIRSRTQKNLFFFRRPKSVSDSSADAQYMQNFKKWIQSSGCVANEYSNLDEFGKLVTSTLWENLLQPSPASQEMKKPDAKQDEVNCTVYAPPSAPPGETFMVQVFAHLLEQQQEVANQAREFDPDAQRGGIQTLNGKIERGSRLTFHLAMPGLEIDDPIQSITWRGKPQFAQFCVVVPARLMAATIIGKVTVSQNSIPLGHIQFKLQIGSQAATARDLAPAGEKSQNYRMAFLSYSSKDREKVLARVQTLQALGIQFFQDVLNLDPVVRWEKQLYHYIDHCDLFLLFWSNAAKESEWVRKELDRAIKRKSGNDASPPEIRPILIEGPPVAPPWPELSQLHFDDRILYLMASETNRP